MVDSSRKVMLDKLRDFCEEVRGRLYHVKRGPIDWAAFDFGRHERAIAILVDDSTFLKDINTASLSLEMAAGMPSQTDDPNIDDGLLDEFTDDAQWIFRSLIGAINQMGDQVILKSNIGSASFTEFYDTQLRIQGVVVFYEVDF